MSDLKYKYIGTPPTKLIEECAELIHALCKAERFGWENFHPDRPNETNRELVRAEMKDVEGALERMQRYLEKRRRAP